MKAKTMTTSRRLLSVGLLTTLIIAVGCEQPIPFSKNGEGYLVNTNESNVMLDGRDPVALLSENKPVPGSDVYQASYQGAVYYFTSSDHRNTFVSAPMRSAAYFGGFCAMSAALGKVEPGSVEHFSINNGRLLLFRNEKALRVWNKNVSGNLAKADVNWPELVARAPGRSG